MNWNTFDFLFLGTSLTSKRTSGAWIDRFQRRMQLTTERPIRCYDFGAPGRTSLYGLQNLDMPLRMKPAVAVLEYGMNDAWPPAGISTTEFRSNIEAICAAFVAQSPATRVFLMTMNPAIAPGASDVPNLLAYYQELRNVASAKGLGLIDVTPAWGVPTSAQLPDGIHPTDAAIDAVLLPFLLATLGPVVV